MTKGGCRDIVRRRLNERAVDDLEDAEIHSLMNEALKLVQKEVIKVDAYAFLGIAYVNTIAGTAGEFYEAPTDMWYEFEVGYKATSTSSYVRLGRGNYHTMREVSAGASPSYARHGRYFAIWPNPTAAVTAGLRIQYMPTLQVGDDAAGGVDDDIALPIHPALHMAVAVWTVMLAMGETMEDRTSLAQELATYLTDLPSWYHRGGDPATLSIDTGKHVY